jgi:hypothetical protein
MRLRRLVILCLLVSASDIVLGQTSVRSQIEAALDSWSSRANTRDAILKVSQDPLPVLIAISKSRRESDVRRSHAIALLATFKSPKSGYALEQLSDESNPKYRCLALQSIVELKSRSAAAVLVRKLDDQAVCMKSVSTDPGEERQVYVSDEAVRLLEQITGQSFDKDSTGGHLATKPWKDWWAKQNTTAGPSS